MDWEKCGVKAKSELHEQIRIALIESCDDALFFSDDETHLIDAEYLLTVNVAKAIKALNHSFGMPYLIYLEHDTGKIATACPPLLGLVSADNFLGHKRVKRSPQNTSRVGKVDIAIYSNNQGIEIPICAIEIKGFNPSKPLILEDLVRNAEYFSKSGITGASQIPFTFFVALHSYKRTMSDEKEASNINKLKKRYNLYKSNLNLPEGISYDLDVFTIRRGLVPDACDPYLKQMGLQGDEDYHFLGVIVCFQK